MPADDQKKQEDPKGVLERIYNFITGGEDTTPGDEGGVEKTKRLIRERERLLEQIRGQFTDTHQ